jgi:hypothetical protein
MLLQKLRGFPQPHLQTIWAGFIHHTMKHLFKHQSSSWFTTIHRNLLYWPRNSYKKSKCALSVSCFNVFWAGLHSQWTPLQNTEELDSRILCSESHDSMCSEQASYTSKFLRSPHELLTPCCLSMRKTERIPEHLPSMHNPRCEMLRTLNLSLNAHKYHWIARFSPSGKINCVSSYKINPTRQSW